jgi:hypothetical protein
MSTPPYTRDFLINYHTQFQQEQSLKIFNDFINSITNSVLGAAKHGLKEYTIREVPSTTTFNDFILGLKINFPDITIKLTDLPGPYKLTSVKAIYITWA